MPDALPKNTPHRVAVISDTHGKLRPEVAAQLRTAEHILHAGDIAGPALLEKLEPLAPVTAVRGNADKALPGLPVELRFALFGVTVYMVHNIRQRTPQADGAGLVIYGHSHKYEQKTVDGAVWLNPGCCGPRRFGQPVTMAMLTFAGDGTFTVERIDLATAAGGGAPVPAAAAATLDAWQAAETVIRDLKRGKAPEQIARAHGLAADLVAQICQIYYTHPGVDVQGVVDRLDIAGS